MVNVPLEIPTELRDFAERSVDQARKAFESFVSAAREAVAAASAASEAGAGSAGAELIGFAARNVGAGFDFAQGLAQAKDLHEALTLHSAFVKAERSALEAQAGAIDALLRAGAAPEAK
jgi:phasin